MTHPNLSTGAIQAIQRNEIDNAITKSPLLQVLAVKTITTSSPPRWRIILSDGVHYMQTLAASQLNDYFSSGKVANNNIVRVNQWVMNTVKNQQQVSRLLSPNLLSSVVIVLDLEVVASNVDSRIGNPIPAAGGDSQPAPAAQPVSHAPPPAHMPANKSNFAHPNQANAGHEQIGQIFPIASLNPYQNKWTICARVLNKSDIKTWSNDKGEGRLFNVTFADESGEIRATAFKEAVTSFYDLLQEGQVYYVSQAKIQMARGKFASGTHNYELTLEPRSQIVPCADKQVKIPAITYKFAKLNSMFNYEKDASVDVIGIVKEVGDVQNIIAKSSQRPLDKRDVTIVDETKHAIRVTLWGKQAISFEGNNHPVIAVKGAKVGDFNGRTLSIGSTSHITMNPDIPEAHRLRGWYDSEGASAEFQTYSNSNAGGAGGKSRDDNFKTVAQIRDENLGQSEKADWFSLKGTVVYIRPENFAYPACSSEGCARKVVPDGDEWRCEKCQKTWPQPRWRYILSLSVADHSGQTWLTAFNEEATQILGINADDLTALKESADPAFEAKFNDACFRDYNFRLRAKQENYNDETKVRVNIVEASPVDPIKATQQLQALIEAYNGM